MFEDIISGTLSLHWMEFEGHLDRLRLMPESHFIPSSFLSGAAEFIQLGVQRQRGQTKGPQDILNPSIHTQVLTSHCCSSHASPLTQGCGLTSLPPAPPAFHVPSYPQSFIQAVPSSRHTVPAAKPTLLFSV